MPEETVIRIDKWLWCVRLYKTRSMATEACRSGRVRINDHIVKPSHPAKAGDVCQIRQEHILRMVMIRQVLSNRVGAKLVAEYYEDLTPPEEYQKKNEDKLARQGIRPAGYGRPTKRERRNMDRFMEN